MLRGRDWPRRVRPLTGSLNFNYMNTFMERMIEEQSQLDERLNKLSDFIDDYKFNTIAPIQQSLLLIQLHAMRTYSQCLRSRLTWFNSDTAT